MTAPVVPLWRTYIVFLLPMMLSNILQALFGTINSIYLGRMLGTAALAAANGCWTFSAVALIDLPL